MSKVLITDKPLGYAKKCSKKSIGFVDVRNPLFVAPLVAIGAYYFVKKAKLI